MKVLLAQLNRSSRIIRTSHPHMGIASIASYSIRDAHETFAIDAMYEGITNKTVFERIKSIKPDLLGLTAKTPDIIECEKIAKKVKGISPQIKVVVGGPHVTALGKRVLEECGYFDFGVSGEGEITFSELVTFLGKVGSHLSEIKGLIFRENNSICENGVRPFIQNLDDLLYPAWHLFPSGSDIALFTSRGCPFKCIFCQRVMGNKVRSMSPQRVVNDIQRSVFERHTRFFQVEDETFGTNKKWTNELLDLILRCGLNKRITWAANSRVNIANYDLYRMMREAGCRMLCFGIESGNQEILDRVHKGIVLEEAIRAIAVAKKAGIRTTAFFILGHPNETPKTVRDTINFACKLNPDAVSFGMMIPYPGTRIYELAKANEGGYLNLSEDWSKYTKYFGGAMDFANLGKFQISRYQRQAYIEFYVRNRRLWDLIPIVKKYINRQS